MEEIHTLAYFGKGYFIDPWDLTGQERDWLLDRLRKQYDEEAKLMDKELAKARR